MPRGIPAALLPAMTPIAVTRTAPSALDQVSVFVDETAIGARPTSLEALRGHLSGLPFEPAMNAIANAAKVAYGLRGNSEAQLAIAAQLYSGTIQRRIEKFFHENDHAELFSEQQVAILARLLIEESAGGALEAGMSEEQRAVITVAIIAAGSVIEEAASTAADAMRDSTDWLAFFVQNGAYNTKPAPLGELVRARHLFSVIARETEMRDPQCPLDEWMREDYGLTIEEQFAIGFALSAMSHAWDDGPGDVMSSRILARDLDDLLERLGMSDRRDDVISLISADRATFAEEFAAGGRDPAQVAWESRPLMRRPFLRLGDDSIVLLSPRGMQSWLSDGFHYRLLDSAQKRSAGDPKRRLSRRYTAYAGKLLEEHVLRLARSAYGPRPIGGGRVYGEQRYGKSGAKTSDVAIDLGLDLVLIEVSASRLRADTVILGTPEKVIEDLTRMLVEKIAQLDRCISALIAGRATVPAGEPEVDLGRVQRIWPVVLTAGTITQTEMLWRFLREHSAGRLAQAKVQPLTLLDPEDFEQLMGLVEGGRDLVAILRGKTSDPYRELELAVYLNGAPGAPRERPRPADVQAGWDDAIAEAQAMLNLTRDTSGEGTE